MPTAAAVLEAVAALGALGTLTAIVVTGVWLLLAACDERGQAIDVAVALLHLRLRAVFAKLLVARLALVALIAGLALIALVWLWLAWRIRLLLRLRCKARLCAE